MWPKPNKSGIILTTQNLFKIPYDIHYKIDVINNNIKYIELQIF